MSSKPATPWKGEKQEMYVPSGSSSHRSHSVSSSRTSASSAGGGDGKKKRGSKDGSSTPLSSYINGQEGRCAGCRNWKQSCSCTRCRMCGTYMVSLINRRHCRMCWLAVCPECCVHRRVVEFARGREGDVCGRCAVPRGVLFLYNPGSPATALAGAGAGSTAGSASATTVEADEAEIEAAKEATATNLPRVQLAGLHLLYSVLQHPRLCVNPSCAEPLGYAAVCAKCGIPTVTTRAHAVRRVGDTAAFKEAQLELLRAAEATVAHCRSALVQRLSVGDVERVFTACLPSGAGTYALHGLREETWAARKLLMATVAASVAGGATPHVTLHLSDNPLARLLRVLRVESRYAVLESPGNVCYVAFPSDGGCRNAAELRQRLSLRLVRREVWTRAGDASRIGAVVASEAEARKEGLTTRVGGFAAQENEWTVVEAAPEVVELRRVVLTLAKDGTDIVLCGHGLGGAAAFCLAAQLLLEHTAVLRDRLLCVTLGAPLATGQGLAELLDSQRLSHNFQHLVMRSDVLPRLTLLPAYIASSTSGCTTAGAADRPVTATPATVVDATVAWMAQRLAVWSGGKAAAEASSPTATASAQSGSGASSKLSFFLRKTKTKEDHSKKRKARRAAAGVGPALDDPEADPGDLFASSREPFYDNIVPAGYALLPAGAAGVVAATEAALSPTVVERFTETYSAPEFRAAQQVEPYGCYSFLWRGRDVYRYTDTPAETLGVLCNRDGIRLVLDDMTLRSYYAGLYMYLTTRTD